MMTTPTSRMTILKNEEMEEGGSESDDEDDQRDG